MNAKKPALIAFVISIVACNPGSDGAVPMDTRTDQGRELSSESITSADSNLEASMRDSTVAYTSLMQQFENTPFFVINGRVVSQADELTTAEEGYIAAAQLVLDSNRNDVIVPDGTAVVVQEDAETTTVIFQQNLPPGVRGGDFLLKVIVDKTSGQATKILN